MCVTLNFISSKSPNISAYILKNIDDISLENGVILTQSENLNNYIYIDM